VGLRILAVDDHHLFGEMLAKMLTALGHQVRTALSGAEGLAALRAERFDLILTDLHMPAMDGYAFAGQVKASFPTTPIVLVTGAVIDSRRETLKARGIDAYLRKPFSIQELETLLNALAASAELTAVA
jgi:CheY-like chemotaxis protein